MSPDGTLSTSTAASSSSWTSIRPWKPPLTLSVREITSVSATFVLSSSVSDPDLEHSLASLGISSSSHTEQDEGPSSPQHHHHREENGKAPEAQNGGSAVSPPGSKKSIISDARLTVKVNNSNYQRVLLRVDDARDEAIIIIYGLMPGRQYDIDLDLVQGDQGSSLQQHFVTSDAAKESPETTTDPDSPSFDRSASSDAAPSTPSTSSGPSTPPSATTPLTLEERLSQLQHTLSLLTSERDALTASLKSARRDAQKADAGLRAQIDNLRRSSEKHAAAEHKAKQKILALQEALKRAQSATRETEELVAQVERDVPELGRRRDEKEQAYAEVKQEADRVRGERDAEEEKERKRLDAMRAELAGLGNKIEKLNAKKDKLQTGTIADLEDKLKEVEHEVESAELEAQTPIYPTPPNVERQEAIIDSLISGTPDPLVDHPLSSPFVSHGRSNPPGIITRPPPQAQPYGHPPSSQSWTSPRQQPHSHSQRSSSGHQHTQPTPVLLTNPQRRMSIKSSSASASTSSAAAAATITAPSAASSSSPSISGSSSPTPSTGPSTTTASTLSSRAPPFEPARPLKSTSTIVSTSSGMSVAPVAIQRPSGSHSPRGAGVSGQMKTSPYNPWAGLQHSPYDGNRPG